MELYSGKLELIVEGWQSAPLLSLREAARLLNPHNAFHGSTCNCKSGCTGRKCTCRQKSAPCSSKCHHGTACENCPSLDSKSHPKKRMNVVDDECCEAQQKKRKIEPNEVVDVDTSDKEDEQSYSLSSQSWLPDLHLNQEDKLILETRQWLSDKHIIAAQELLSKQFPHVQGLQLPFLEQRDQFKAMPPIGVQILNENNKHWLCVSTMSSLPDTIDIYDSLRMKRISTHVIKQCSLLLNSQEKTIFLRAMQAQQQSGGSDCGLFAIANATELCFGLQPSHSVYNQSSMREHLINCFSHHKLLPFPKQTVDTKPTLLSTTEVKVYCICRLPEDNRQKMARCVSCLEWFHQKCLNIPANAFRKNTKNSFTCPKC